MKKTRTAFMVAIFVATTSAVTIAQAEGFFSSLFGGSKGAGFKTMITHVPADTSYMLGNKKPIPDEVMAFHLSRGQEMMKMISAIEPSKSKDDNDGKDPEAFFKALFDDLGDKLSEEKFEDTGLSLKATSLIYGYDMLPVIRMSFSDKEKLMATLKRAEEKSGYKVELSKCGDFDCFIGESKDDKSAAVVILENHLAASFFSPEQKDKVIDHLTGKTSPKEAYAEDKWDDFLKENGYAGYGDGFVNLKALFAKATPLIEAGIKANAKTKIDDKESKACLAVAEEHINNMPEIIMGAKTLEAKNMDYEIVFKTSEGVSKALQTIANKTNIPQRSEGAIIDFGLNINFMKMRDALTEYSGFLIKSGKTHGCKSIKEQDIRKGMGGMAMVMNMGLTQFKSIYASVVDIELDDKMQPKNVDAYMSIGTDDPAGLISMVGMMSPALMGFQIPTDGTAVKLPEAAIPSKGLPVPPIYLSRSDNSLNIMVGNDKPKLKDHKNDKAEIFTTAMDGKRYYEKLASVMKALPPEKGTDQEKISKMMDSMGSMMGKFQQEVHADKRGLVIDYHIQY